MQRPKQRNRRVSCLCLKPAGGEKHSAAKRSSAGAWVAAHHGPVDTKLVSDRQQQLVLLLGPQHALHRARLRALPGPPHHRAAAAGERGVRLGPPCLLLPLLGVLAMRNQEGEAKGAKACCALPGCGHAGLGRAEHQLSRQAAGRWRRQPLVTDLPRPVPPPSPTCARVAPARVAICRLARVPYRAAFSMPTS